MGIKIEVEIDIEKYYADYKDEWIDADQPSWEYALAHPDIIKSKIEADLEDFILDAMIDEVVGDIWLEMIGRKERI